MEEEVPKEAPLPSETVKPGRKAAVPIDVQLKEYRLKS